MDDIKFVISIAIVYSGIYFSVDSDFDWVRYYKYYN